ncbi:cobalamin-independent methionine synthase II family protein [Conexibacter woesei]|uniref:Methionine synthase II (Cobalamin-independent)-like protein n=1 Tax=Conexibacter woesei (strain DSM 14684 / CCUG 47730 / CIP 108061 / JCM 11494 / NBRC 100937 / ID131577) TaxID=469383 RepID=D3FAR8_CONWI|nr:cobalamin-independent methionine synthase II family protein [Conexibacter woesei]ADB51231.1 Methionine synthase II (cobalamin-independent)- like protein [Conexibacter woesei DSM 14684]
MKTSDTRILTTHVGSLPRSRALLDLLVAIENGEEVDRELFRSQVADDLDHVVTRQLAAGVDVGGDGEMPRIGFSQYVKDRMTGFGGVAQRGVVTDLEKFPGYAELKGLRPTGNELRSSTLYTVPEAQDRVVYDPELAVAREELELFAAALGRASGAGFEETFVTAVSPGLVTTTLLRAEGNPAYADDREYLADVSRELKQEYEYVAAQGHVLQIDCPDLAFERNVLYRDRPWEEFLERIGWHVAALNDALADIPRERVRMHVCWGNWDGPHIDDIDLEPLLETVYRANVGAISMAGANPRHQHEYKLFGRYPLPDGVVLAPGVIDVTYNYLEHPEVVADRICRYAEAIGDPTRVIACTDCGFSTFAGYTMVAEDVVWKKLEILAEGARIATDRLFG